MTDTDKLEMAYKLCKPLYVDCIKKELEDQLEKFTLNSIEGKPGGWTVGFEDSFGNYITLSISFNSFRMLKITSTKIECITTDEKLLLTHRVVDKRQNGIVYSIVQKQFNHSNKYSQIVLTDLIEQRFTLTKEKINSLSESSDFDNIGLNNLLLKLIVLERKVDLKSQSDFYSEFSTHMNYLLNLYNGKTIKDNIYPTRTYLNGEEFSNIFDVDGPNKLYRIYDLYNGIINPRNEYDIKSIHFGFLPKEAFNFKELKGINKQEDSLVGIPLINVSDAYINYLREFFDNKFGYKGSIGIDRESMLLGITYQMSGHERTKREIERKLGIPYNEFKQLDFDEQQKLIEQKTGKKFKYDHRIYIDGIPMDEDHIITREQIDKQIEKLTSSGPKRLLKRLLRPFNKK